MAHGLAGEPGTIEALEAEGRSLRELLSGQAVDIAERETMVRRLREQNKALLEALKPFAAAIDDIDVSDIEDDSTWDATVSLGDIRKARAAIAKAEAGDAK